MSWIDPIIDRTEGDLLARNEKAFFNVADWQRVYDNTVAVRDQINITFSIDLLTTEDAEDLALDIPEEFDQASLILLNSPASQDIPLIGLTPPTLTTFPTAGEINHVNLANKGTNTHAQIDAALAGLATTYAPKTHAHTVDQISDPGAAFVPIGGIILWSGLLSSIPAGWALCNGNNGTPDLRDKFIVGAGGTYAKGATGGTGGAGGAGAPGGNGGNGGGAAGLVIMIAPSITYSGTVTGRFVKIEGAEAIEFLRGFDV